MLVGGLSSPAMARPYAVTYRLPRGGQEPDGFGRARAQSAASATAGPIRGLAIGIQATRDTVDVELLVGAGDVDTTPVFADAVAVQAVEG